MVLFSYFYALFLSPRCSLENLPGITCVYVKSPVQHCAWFLFSECVVFVFSKALCLFFYFLAVVTLLSLVVKWCTHHSKLSVMQQC
jgi:hypothetical protein